ncbi:glycosyltransferase family 2 protein [Marinobacter lutaoensis]|jgi:GT2 family glycosyltransferase|uniref:glycosyltransferase family 2 protein n=1 Tax=Marinobacter lutaoensis TaxID=135739 RepID=UPI0015943CFE|nr:glycosyltransferase family 2 protein [Marinobacter lutaoensis]NVD35546.1 glycosyltransferase family 2 protein [Marinobacter lutaoensis]|tara:strand:- start:274 stop:1119 length:846 start_codon:yes stop_codon:yes gene_type:complete
MASQTSSVTVAIVSYNSYDTIRNCMSDLIQSQAYPITIVDNASPDQSAQKLKSRYPHITVIESSRNLGYGGAANLALARATTPFVLLVNPDLKLTVEAVGRLESVVNKKNVNATLLAPAVQKKDHIRQGLVKRRWVIGAAMLFDMSRLKKIGFFDEKIFLFSEETDLCFRIRKAGQEIILDTDTYIEHLSGRSSTPSPVIEDLKNWHFGWSQLYFHDKHGLATGKKNPYRVSILYFIKSLVSLKAEKRVQYKARFLGARAYLRGEPAILPDGTPQWPRLHH